METKCSKCGKTLKDNSNLIGTFVCKSCQKKQIEDYIEKWKAFQNIDWSAFKKPETFAEAVAFLEFVTMRGEDPQWSIQYYGFGEHFTFWSGYGGFIDFDIDNGTAISWQKLKDIIVESAQALYDDLQEKKPHLFRKIKL